MALWCAAHSSGLNARCARVKHCRYSDRATALSDANAAWKRIWYEFVQMLLHGDAQRSMKDP
jgi:hypothetical protein